MERLRGLKPRVLFYSHYGIGREPEELISRAAEITKSFGDLIMKAWKEGETVEAIDQKLQSYISTNFGLNVRETFSRPTVEGYIFYFKKKGLV